MFPTPRCTLVPGMYAEVDLITEQRNNALTVPVEAVDGSGDAARVFAVRPSGEIEIVPVRLGVETAQRVEIRSGDLQEGDEVVVGSRAALKRRGKSAAENNTLAGAAAPKS